MTETPDPVATYLAEVQKNWEVFGDGHATPRLLAAVEAVRDLLFDHEGDPVPDAWEIPAGQFREAISRALLGEDGT